MVEVEVRDDDGLDVVGAAVGLVERVSDPAILEREDVAALVVEFVARADFKEDEFRRGERRRLRRARSDRRCGGRGGVAVTFEEKAVVLDADSAALVGGDGL